MWKTHAERRRKIKKLRESGYSIPEISKKLKCSKSVVSYNCKGVIPKTFDRINKAKKANAAKGTKANKDNWTERRKEVAKEATTGWNVIRADPDMMAFLALYWGEGTKSHKTHEIAVVNNDPGIIKFCLGAFKKLTSTNIECIVRHYPDLDESACKTFWESILGISVSTKKRKLIGKHRKPTSKYGTCTIRLCDWQLRVKILTWIKCFRDEICGQSFEHIESYHGVKM